jgi:hypothetical protein
MSRENSWPCRPQNPSESDTFLESIRDPGHPEHQMYREWIGGEFDPEEFDLEETNEILQELR